MPRRFIITTKPPATLKPPTRKPAGRPTSKPSVGKTPPREVKSFAIVPWTGANEGEKIIAYGPSGIGKTTLAAMAPTPVFLGVDDGGRKIVNPITGKLINKVDGIETFQDVRDALQAPGLFDQVETIVIDTITKLEELMQHFAILNITFKGAKVQSFRQFGWDGPEVLVDQFRLLMSDLDSHTRAGRNVILLAQQGQIRRSSASTDDYLEDGPFISHTNRYSAREELKQWADHVLRIGYLNLQVHREKDAKAGKVVSEGTERAIFSAGAQHFTAKSRPINGHQIPDVISFEALTDDSLWQYIFGGAVAEKGGD